MLGGAACAGDDDAGDEVLSFVRECVQNHIPNGWAIIIQVSQKDANNHPKITSKVR